MRGKNGSYLPLLLLALLVALAAPSPARAQDVDFLFGAPRAAVTVRGGFLIASTDSDLYDFFGDLLTIEPGDFNAPTFGLDAAIAIHPRVDVLFGMDFSRAGISSEYRDFVEANDLPILQETTLTAVPLTAGLKL
jgi:hypothetical protein